MAPGVTGASEPTAPSRRGLKAAGVDGRFDGYVVGMLTVSGYGITATFDDDTLTIEGNNKAARIALAGQDHADGPVRVAANEITDLSWKSAGRLTNGNLTVTTGSGKRFQMHFLKKHSADMEALMRALESARTS